MKERIIKYLERELAEFDIEIEDYETLNLISEHPNFPTDDGARERIKYLIGFSVEMNGATVRKLNALVRSGFYFTYSLSVREYITNIGAIPKDKDFGDQKTTVCLDIRELDENFMKSILGISKYNL